MNAPREIVAEGLAPADVVPKRNISGTDLIPGIVFLLDVIVCLISILLYSHLMLSASPRSVQYYVVSFLVISILSIFLFERGGLFHYKSILNFRGVIELIILSKITSLLLLISALMGLGVAELYRMDLILGFVAALVCGICCARFVFGIILLKVVRDGILGRRIAVVGSGARAVRLIGQLDSSPAGLAVVTAVYDPESTLVGEKICDQPVLGGVLELLAAARSGQIDDIVFAMSEPPDAVDPSLVERLRELPVNVYLAPAHVDLGRTLRPVEHLSDLPLFELWQRPISGWSRVMKLALDYILAGLALILLAPAMVCIAIAIRVDSGGPVLFRQKRLGFNNQTFEIIKFRTMHHDPLEDGPIVQARRSDPRVTRVGGFLRRTSLDELPQLLNVLNGTMSLVGPRPHALSHNKDFARSVRGYFGRHKVKPGITGWAQVNGLRGEIDSHEKLEARVAHDVHYAENWSLVFDLRILFVTIFVVLFQRNAY